MTLLLLLLVWSAVPQTGRQAAHSSVPIRFCDDFQQQECRKNEVEIRWKQDCWTEKIDGDMMK